MTAIGAHPHREAHLLHLATHDELTGLRNRSSFVDGVTEVLATSTDLSAMLFVDLDKFKDVNDQLGHRYGDELLKAVCRRLESSTRPSDLIGRLGGDEFGVFCSSLSSVSEPVRLAERMVRTLGQPFSLDGQTVIIDASIGVAVAAGPETSADSLIDDADQAMYVAKAGGGGRCSMAGEATLSIVRPQGDAGTEWTELLRHVSNAEAAATQAWQSGARTSSPDAVLRLGAIRSALRRAATLLRDDTVIDTFADLALVNGQAPETQARRLQDSVESGIVVAQAEGILAHTTGADPSTSGAVLRQCASARGVDIGTAAHVDRLTRQDRSD